MDDVAERRHGLGAVRVVREQGPAGGRAAGRDRPVVAALRRRIAGARNLRLEVAEADATGTEPVQVESLGWRRLEAEEVEVQALRYREPMVRLVAVAEREGLQSVVRQERGPGELAHRVP